METNRVESGSQYYDMVFNQAPYFRCHYSESHYYPLMLAALKRLNPQDNILELGCGTGQMAHLLWDKGFTKYLGIDFSPEGIRQARKNSIQQFHLGTIYKKYSGFDTVLIMEVLEHIDDIRVLKSLESGVKVIATLPDFEEEVSHLRYFTTEKEIRQRYQFLQFNHIEKIGRWWLFEAVR